jgi:protein-export membrane protein SecD
LSIFNFMSDNFLKKIFKPSARTRLSWLVLLIFVAMMIGAAIDAPQYYNKGVDWISYKTGNKINLFHIEETKFRLGLDLQGGSHLVYSAAMDDISSADRATALEGVRDVIERRVNAYGVSEPIVQTSISGGEHRIIVELAGIKDVNEAINMIGETPLLEFKEQVAEERELTEEEIGRIEDYNNEANTRAAEALGKVLSGEDFSEIAKEYSQDSNTKDNGGDLGWIESKTEPAIVEVVKDLEKGDITEELVEMSYGYEILKLIDKKNKTNPFDESQIEKEVKASHILICHNETEGCEGDISKEDALAQMKEVEKKATAKNFADLAVEYSTGPSSTKGGDIGWFERGAMLKPFSDTVFDNTEVGEISYIVETKFGYHLILKVEERDLMEYKVSHIALATMSERDILNQEQWKLTELTGKNLDGANVARNPNDGSVEVALVFDAEGGDMFAEVTGRNIGKPVGIFLDGYPISTPNVNEKITGGRAVVSGNFSIQEAQLLAQRLNAGALPVPIELISQQTVGASLGHKSLVASLEAGFIGLVLVALFMIFYYRLPGIVAVVSLLFYGILVLMVFKTGNVTLTLAGMAGFILSIGMAVDANVLIFERLKEELSDGNPLNMAIENAFARAWPSIRDGNISTLITCFILIQFSTGIVKGFAITLGIGVMISMLSAIIVTKALLQFTSSAWLERNLWLIGKSKVQK